MKLETFNFVEGKGWSIKPFPDLDSENTLVLAFSDPKFLNNLEPIHELSRHFSKSKIIGCSSAGEIIGANVLENSISVAVVRFEKTPIKIVTVPIKSAVESYNAGEKISQMLNQDNLRGIFVLSEGLNINGSELAKGLDCLKRKDIVITGGLAGDGSQFKKTWTIANGKILTDSISAVGFYGNKISIGHGSCGGWDIFGIERRITRSKGNTLFELDGQPALDLYKEYLGDKAVGLPATGLLFPLAIRKDKNDTNQLVRTILAVNESDKSLTFAGDTPMGYLAQLMRANFDRLVTGANTAGKLALSSIETTINANETPLLLIAISCVGRRLLLGERTDEETQTLIDLFPPRTKQIGFYSYGELSPYSKGSCDLHNQTMTLTAISEEA